MVRTPLGTSPWWHCVVRDFLKKALAIRAGEPALRGGPRPCDGHRDDEVAVREHVKVALLLVLDIKAGITEAVKITP